MKLSEHCRIVTLLALVAMSLPGCRFVCRDQAAPKTFTEDVAFLARHTQPITLSQGQGKVAVVPEYQGRVMTSTTGGPEDLSFGWLNYAVIEEGVLSREKARGKLQEHIHVFGGEERFWMGPEGGQFAIFFRPGAKFVFDDWFTPAVMDTEPFKIESRSDREAVFAKDFALTNYSGTDLNGSVRRTVRVLDAQEIATALGVALPAGVRGVAYETKNELTNRGPKAWERNTGLLSIWLLGMFKPGPETTMVIPFKQGAEAELGPAVNDTYFGKVPADRLIVKEDVLFFRGDGKYRSKIGISPVRSRGTAGSYDARNGVLTLVTYNEQPADKPYVNSMWEIQKAPFAGDVVNAYNDGPPEPGMKPLGPFYELETSSPAAELKPGESLTHVQRTFHLQGSPTDLDPIARKLLGASIETIRSAFGKTRTSRE